MTRTRSSALYARRANAWLAVLLIWSCSEAKRIEGYPDEYAGVGLELRVDEGTPVVVRAIEDGPGAEAGLLEGDKIMDINGVSTTGSSLGDVVVKLRGKAGSQVTLGLQRGSTRIVAVVRRMPI